MTDIQYIPQSCRKKVYQPHSNNIHQLYNTKPAPLQIKINTNDGFLRLFTTAIYVLPVTSDFRHGVNEIFATLGFYGAQIANLVNKTNLAHNFSSMFISIPLMMGT